MIRTYRETYISCEAVCQKMRDVDNVVGSCEGHWPPRRPIFDIFVVRDDKLVNLAGLPKCAGLGLLYLQENGGSRGYEPPDGERH